MPPCAKELTPAQIKNLKHPGGDKAIKLPVGGVLGLYVQITPSGAKSWVLRTRYGEWAETRLKDGTIQRGRKKREIGLGAYAPAQAAAKPFPFVAVGDLEYRPPEFLVADLIETDTLGLLFGDPGCGKSFLAADLALSVATGHDFHGHPVKQGAAFYIAGEGHNGLVRRFHAWAQHNDQPIKGAPMFKSERAAQFLDGASAQAVTASVRSLAAQHGAPALIVVDTLARNFGAGDENSTQEMNQFIVAMDDLRANWPGCVVLIVHHSGHADKGRARGAMALKGALDFEYRMTKNDLHIEVANTKMKDAEPPPDMAFCLHGVEIESGVKSAVLVEGEAQKKSAKVTSGAKLGLSTYTAAAMVAGQWVEDAFRGVHTEDWRKEFYRKHTGDSDEAKKKAFQRARKDLTETGHIEVTDDVYLIKDPGIQLAIITNRDKRDNAGHVPACPGTNGTNA